MLNENTTETTALPAAQIRVRREEFARAISALEARRQEEARYLEGTVAVEDTLRELQVDVSTEEVMQQIEAQRAGYAADEEPRRVLDPDKVTDFKLVSSIILVPLLAVFLWVTLYHAVSTPYPLVSAPSVSPPASTRIAPSWMPPPMMPLDATQWEAGESGFNASSVLKPLSQVPDNQPVHCNSGSLGMLLGTYVRQRLDRPYDPSHPLGTRDPAVLARSDQLFDVRATSRKPWILIKHDGRLYLRAWVAAKFTQAQAEVSIVTLHSSPRSFDPGVHPVQITLPLSFRANVSPFGSSQFERSAVPTLSVNQVSLDQHAWEK